MHKLFMVITILAFICGIADLVLNVAILNKVSNGEGFHAVSDAFSAPKPLPTIVMPTVIVPTVTATPSATPKFFIKPTITK